ncbi:MAG: OadG family protein [Dehalococcoidia bacterium]|jgi:Na+-transporting methylmalonyl-CoA/oxaloacetate decarboxylase gamma subunit|nr:OadG family protein [Dehalococcoidia bacterium]
MSQGLFVTWAGMAVVFSVLIVLILFMMVLGRVFKPKPEEE